ncbi:MAG: DNA-processing protein DprA [Candidatus Scatovivens sp.]
MEYKILKIDDKKYPEKLKKINNPPKILYYIGNLELLTKPSIAVVGTRNITDYGIKIAKHFSTELAKKFVIISGMAIGTDTIAHKSALNINCDTIAVLGGGFNHIFPEENLELFHEIIRKNGLVLSEYSPKVYAKSANFPKRNRIVSGLSDGILVIEAGYRSGTSITVDFAKKQNKKVFAIPGRLDSKYGIGVNKMIKNGAILVTDVKDIVRCYPQLIEKKWKTTPQFTKIKEEYREIYGLLEENILGIEELYMRLKNKDIRQINKLLTMMEIENLIEQEFGVGYKIKKGEE